MNEDRITLFCKELSEFYFEGNRHTFLEALSGTLVKRNIPEEIALFIYNKLHEIVFDSENRSNLVSRSYLRNSNGQRVKTISSLAKYDEGYKRAFEIINRYFPDDNVHRYTESDEAGLRKWINTVNRMLNGDDFRLVTHNLNSIGIPFDSKLHLSVTDYFLYRGIPTEYLKENDISVLVGINKLSDYVVFPIFKDKSKKECVYYAGRLYQSSSKRKHEKSKGSQDYFWNHEGSYGKDEIILAEGVFSALSAQIHSGIHSIASLTKNISYNQIKKLNKYKVINLCYDHDAYVSHDIIEKIVKNVDSEIYLIPMPKSMDPNNMDSATFNFFLKNKKKVKKENGWEELSYILNI